jgi:hypothetical protein
MRWDDRIGDLFADLEQQADGLALAARDAEVAEQSRAEYASVDLASRLHGSVGARLLVTVTGAGPLDATLARVGVGWCLLDAGPHEWVVRLAAVGGVRGLSERAVAEQARPVTARLGLGSALRGVVEARTEVVLHRVDGTQVPGTLRRVGADFVEVAVGEGRSGYLEAVPFGALAAVRSC